MQDVFGTESLADSMLADKPTELSRIKQKLELNSKLSALSIPLPIGFHAWLC